MKYLDGTWTVGAVVANLPEAAGVFDAFHIDFCCGGNRPLLDVVNQQDIDKGALADALEKARGQRSGTYKGMGHRFTEMEPTVLSTYIEDTHHSYLRSALPELLDLLNTVLRAHGKNHRELFMVYSLFSRLKGDLEQHLLKEEALLFPAFADQVGNTQEISTLSAEIISEHEAAGVILSELRRVTKNYRLPEDACPSYKKAYKLLVELENDLHQHIHLENNILLRDYDTRQPVYANERVG